MKLQWLGFETDEGEASPLKQKEAKLREELSKFISETQRQTMEFCASVSVTKALGDFPKAFAVWIRDCMTLSNIDNLQVYNETLKAVMEEHRQTVDQTLWLEFIDKVENECDEVCKYQLDQVHEAVTQFIASIKQVFTDEGCFSSHAKLDEFGMGELKRICESLEEKFVQPAVHTMCQELLSTFKVQNDSVQTAEKRYTKTFINSFLKEYNSEMENDTDSCSFYHSPCILRAIKSTLCDTFFQMFQETFPANKVGLQEIHQEQLQELKVSLGQAFHKYKAVNQKNVEKGLPGLNKRFEKLNGGGTEIVETMEPASQDEKWIGRYIHESSRLEELLECEIQLACLKDDEMKALQWKSLQSSLDMPLVFEEFQVKKRVPLEKKRESALQGTKKFFHKEMQRFITTINSGTSTETLPLTHSALLEKCTRGFQDLISAYLDFANISSEVEKLSLELSNTLKMYQTKFDARLKEIKAELNKIVANTRSDYVERMKRLFKQDSNRLSLIDLHNAHDAAVVELKKLLEIELKKRFEFEDPEVHWQAIKVLIDTEFAVYRRKARHVDINKLGWDFLTKSPYYIVKSL